MYSLLEYNYDLPEKLIAQAPVQKRDQSRLLYLNRKTDEVSHHHFYRLCDFLNPGDILVINNTEVIPGRLLGTKSTGGKVEVLLLGYGTRRGAKKRHSFTCEGLVKSSKPPKPGTRLIFDRGLTGKVLSGDSGIYTIQFTCDGDFEHLMYQIGRTPLPPYIHRPTDKDNDKDRFTYQTVYASEKGAIAAPTAGLHFTRDLLDRLIAKSVKIVAITLHVGYGTFSPVRESDIRLHRMHSESYYISKESAETINRYRKKGARIVAVGTTCVRTLEYASDDYGVVVDGSGDCDLFIYPGYRFKMIDGMITNFHLPQSTLLMLVSAFVGKDKLMHVYKEAIEKGYRFYSYGDAMLIL